jgi:PBSX family phage terminase large subunit
MTAATSGTLLSSAQVASIRASTGRVNVWSGSIRSGKTIASLLRWLMFVASAPEGGALVIVARTRDTAARNILAPLADPALFGAASRAVDYNYGAPTATILGRRVYVIGASDAKAEKVIRGLTVAGAYVDEITVIPEEFFTQLLGRMSVPGAQLFGTTNPDNPAHWLKAKYLNRVDKLPDWRSFHFTLHDNPSLTPEYVTAISTEFTGLWYRRFILGEWVAAEGAIYDMWDPAKHVVPWGDLPPMRALLAAGVDYGTNHATAAVIVGIDHTDGLWLVDEWRHDPAQTNARWTDTQLSAGLREWLAQPHLPVQQAMRAPVVAVDPAAASLRLQLAQDGLEGIVLADNDVSVGIRVIASLLGTGRLRVADRCTGVIAEMPGYSWDPEAAKRGLDKPIKIADDSLDAARYGLITTMVQWADTLEGHVVTADELFGIMAPSDDY